MKNSFLILIALITLAVSCSPDEERIRQIVRQELSEAQSIQYIKPGDVIGPYTPAVRVGPFLFVSGQIALDPNTGAMVQDNIEAETRQVLSNLNRVLKAAGYDSSTVVSATVYLKNINDYQRVNQVYGQFFPADKYPARVAVEVSALPRQANIEIAAVAYR